MTFEEWFEKYKPVDNPSGECHGCGIDDRDSVLHSFFGEDWDAVRKADPNKVWTLLDCEGIWIVTNGLHRVNREGFFITEVELHPEDDMLEVYYDEDEREAGCEA